MTSLHLSVLGSPRLERDGRVVQLNLRRAMGMLVYLGVTGRPQARESLAALLWPDTDEPEARARLRRTLHRLGEALGSDALVARSGSLSLAPQIQLELDCRLFEQQAVAGLSQTEAPSTEQRLALLTQAAGLYTDDFLAGFTIPDSPVWDEWQFLRREQLRGLAARVMERLAEILLERRDWDSAIGYARRWLALDGLHEPAHRKLIELYSLAGQQGAALRQYQECVRLLDSELGVEPEPATTELYESVRARRQTAPASVDPAPAVTSRTTDRPARIASRPVGREAELDQLQEYLQQSLSGRRQVVFISGEAGLGKTALVEAFLAVAESRQSLVVGRGQCLEHRGIGEPYMPVLEALGRLCRGEASDRMVSLLAQRAPTWLVQMPGLVSAGGVEALQSRVLGATRDRMLREMVEALEALSADRPLVLVLEDLHWADYSTIDLLERLARRSEQARLLVIGTYRPGSQQAGNHPLEALARELCVRGLGTELPLPFLPATAVATYLAGRLADAPFTDDLASVLHERTEGNPLFMVNVVDSWIGSGHLREQEGSWMLQAELDRLATAVPDGLRQTIEHQLSQLDPVDQELLEVASVTGPEFSTAAASAALAGREEECELRCAVLARMGQFLAPAGVAEWPDGTTAAEFRFIHHLYQDVLYQRVPPGRRSRLHRQVGERLESAYGDGAPLIAGQLAVHFVAGGDRPRAVHYLRLSAEQALQRNAYHEAVGHLSLGLAQALALPHSADRDQLELGLQAALAPALIPLKGWAAPEVAEAYARAHALCRRLDDPPESFAVMRGLATLYEYRGQFQQSQEMIEDHLRLSSRLEDSEQLIESHELLACTLFHQGAFEEAAEQAEQALGLFDPSRHASVVSLHGKNAGVACHGWVAQALWFRGYPSQALSRMELALNEAVRMGHLYSLASAQSQRSFLHQYRREAGMAERWADAALALALKQGFRYREATGTMVRGWALANRGEVRQGIAALERGLDLYQETGAQMDRPYFLALLAEAHKLGNDPVAGLVALDEALTLVDGSRAFFYEAELHRLQGELLILAGGSAAADAEICLQRALDLARRQGARSLELRAAISLVRLWQRENRLESGRALLGEIVSQWSEGLETPDLREALALNAELGRSPSSVSAPF